MKSVVVLLGVLIGPASFATTVECKGWGDGSEAKLTHEIQEVLDIHGTNTPVQTLKLKSALLRIHSNGGHLNVDVFELHSTGVGEEVLRGSYDSFEGKSDFMGFTGAVHVRLNRCERNPWYPYEGSKCLNSEKSISFSCRKK